MRGFKTLIALIMGKAIVITKTDSDKADVVVGKSVSKHFALSSMIEACKYLML